MLVYNSPLLEDRRYPEYLDYDCTITLLVTCSAFSAFFHRRCTLSPCLQAMNLKNPEGNTQVDLYGDLPRNQF
jgi:hypothetical protein